MADITITEGDTLEVDYSLENTGDGTGTFDPRLLVQGVQEDQDSGITLDPTQTATGTLEWPTESGDAVTDALAEAVTDDTSDSITVTVESTIPDSGVFRYRFEDDSDTSTATDDWNSNNGTISGASYSTTEYEGSFGLDIGQNEYVDAGSVLQSAPFSISVWIYQPDWNARRFNYVASWEQGLSPYSGWSLRDDSNESTPFEFLLRDGSGNIYSTTASRPPTDTWTLITGTYGNDGTVTLYKDDTQADQTTGADGSITSAPANTYLGNSDGFNDRGLGGVVDDARGYNKELSPTEVSNRFNTGSING